MFTLNMKGFRKTKNLKRELEEVVGEIQNIVPRADIAVYIHPETSRKNLFTVSMIVSGLRKKVVVTEHDSNLYSMIQNAKRIVINQLHKMKEKQVSNRTRDKFRARKVPIPVEESYAY